MHVLVTGASGGIGRETVRTFARNPEIHVYAISRSEEMLESLQNDIREEFNREIQILSVDFHEDGFQRKVVDFLSSKTDTLDLLLNNAGVLINKKFEEVNVLDIREQLRVNLESPLLLTQSMIPFLKNSSQAHVVNIGSMGGYMGSQKFPGLSVYSAAKGALAILTECLAAEYVDDGLAFNCLALGSADTEMLRKAFPDYKSPTSASQMADFIVDFAMKGHRHFNGKVLPVAGLST